MSDQLLTTLNKFLFIIFVITLLGKGRGLGGMIIYKEKASFKESHTALLQKGEYFIFKLFRSVCW